MNEDLVRVWRKIDEHTEKHTKSDEKFAMIHAFIDEQKRNNLATCKIMTETREEVMTTVNTRFDSQDTLLQQLLADKHRKEGEEEANRKNRLDEEAKTAFRFSLINSFPNIMMVLSFIAGLWLISQQFISHK